MANAEWLDAIQTSITANVTERGLASLVLDYLIGPQIKENDQIHQYTLVIKNNTTRTDRFVFRHVNRTVFDRFKEFDLMHFATHHHSTDGSWYFVYHILSFVPIPSDVFAPLLEVKFYENWLSECEVISCVTYEPWDAKDIVVSIYPCVIIRPLVGTYRGLYSYTKDDFESMSWKTDQVLHSYQHLLLQSSVPISYVELLNRHDRRPLHHFGFGWDRTPS